MVKQKYKGFGVETNKILDSYRKLAQDKCEKEKDIHRVKSHEISLLEEITWRWKHKNKDEIWSQMTTDLTKDRPFLFIVALWMNYRSDDPSGLARKYPEEMKEIGKLLLF